MAGFRNKVGFFIIFSIILKKGFSEIFTGDRLTQTNPSLKLSLLQGLEFKDFCVKNAIVVIHLRFFVGSSFIIINNKKNKVKSCGSWTSKNLQWQKLIMFLMLKFFGLPDGDEVHLVYWLSGASLASYWSQGGICCLGRYLRWIPVAKSLRCI